MLSIIFYFLYVLFSFLITGAALFFMFTGINYFIYGGL